MTLAPDDPRHGTVNGYSNLRCRCDGCRAAWAAHVREQRARFASYELPTDAHGRLSTYTNYGCRCDECRAAKNAHERDYKALNMTAGRVPPTHGISGYANFGCRCRTCRAAEAARQARKLARRASALAADPSIVEHGKRNTYNAWGCRCDACTEAQREYRRARRKAIR